MTRSARKNHGFTLAEIIIAVVLSAIVLLPICGILQLALRRWDVQASYNFAVQKSNVALQRIQADGSNAISDSFSTRPSGNLIYYFTIPLDKDANGHYIPERVDADLTYVDGTDVGYYLSDITGNVDVTGGTVLWRATRPASTSTWTPDTSWSKVNTNVARCSSVQSLVFDSTTAPPNAVKVTITVQQVQGHTTKTYTQSREIYEEYHN